MKQKVLLTSVCRPLGAKYGDAPSVGYELLYGQVTRAQGLFSPRAVHIQFSLEYIAENLDAPTVVMQYPSRRELIRELKKGYDYVGLCFIMAVFHKMKDAVALIRQYAPQSKIILGGYGTVLGDDVLKPYADYICREEGVAFMRRLLGEAEKPMPYHHPLIVSELKVFGQKVSETGMIFAGLGCPNGCDFCCTSHFFARKHIRLLPTGQDILDVIDRYQAQNPDMVFTILDEDFLLNKERAMEFRECAEKSNKTLSIFAFASVKAISQYTIEEILELGIDGLWIGYEGTRSGYAKQEGRGTETILRECREHGITVLASMIVGFDYQTPEVIAQELDGLMRLKPSLSQFLIYGPVPGTPFYERVTRDNLMRDEFTKDPELYYRSADGFTTMIKHPTLSPAAIEKLQRWCFDEDFQRLGPSIFRVLETQLLGYQKLIQSPNPRLRRKAEISARQLRMAYPVFLAGKWLGPNAAVRGWIADLERRVYQALGSPRLRQRFQSILGVGAALWTGLTLKLNLFQHPKLRRTSYRMPDHIWSAAELWEEIQHKITSPNLSIHVEWQQTRERVWLRLEGVLHSADAESLAKRISEALERSKSRLVLDLNKLHWDKVGDLEPMRQKLNEYRSRIRLVLPRMAGSHPEVILLAGMFKHYLG